jgi:ribulose-phosphate 3-epimerase
MGVDSKTWLDVSLWSADLARLAEEIRRLEPFADSFHLDASDGTLARALLFFPDLIRAIRPITTRPLHVHLMAQRSARWVDDFAEAGADWITIHAEAADAAEALERVRQCRKRAGIALQLETPAEVAIERLQPGDVILLLGTAIGVKGASLDPSALPRLQRTRTLLDQSQQLNDVTLMADGAIRQQTAPQLIQAGAGAIVPGSLLFSSATPAEMSHWLRNRCEEPSPGVN